MIDELFATFEGAFAENTIRGYRADFDRFCCWCADHGVAPLDASPEDLASFIETMALTLASGTIRRRVASLGTIYRMSDLPDIGKAPVVMLAMKRLYRQIRKPRYACVFPKPISMVLVSYCRSVMNYWLISGDGVSGPE
jgi:site-specific recombinase XerD